MSTPNFKIGGNIGSSYIRLVGCSVPTSYHGSPLHKFQRSCEDQPKWVDLMNKSVFKLQYAIENSQIVAVIAGTPPKIQARYYTCLYTVAQDVVFIPLHRLSEQEVRYNYSFSIV